MTRIDAHARVFARASSHFPREVSDSLPADREAPVETLLSCMEAHYIGQAVLVQHGGARFEHHAYLLHCLATYPDRFRGIARLPPDEPHPEALMDRLADGTGIIGFHLSRFGGPADPFEPVHVEALGAYPIWRHAARRDHVLWLHLESREAHLLPYLLEAFPQVRVVLSHLGLCLGKDRETWDASGRPRIGIPQRCSNHLIHTTARLESFENVVVMLAAQGQLSARDYPYEDLAPCHRSLLGIYGARRLLWGSDFPWPLEAPGYERITGLVGARLPSLSAAEQEDVMGENARRFFRFPRTGEERPR